MTNYEQAEELRGELFMLWMKDFWDEKDRAKKTEIEEKMNSLGYKALVTLPLQPLDERERG